MKQFLHASSLRTRLAPAALALAFGLALLAPPSQAAVRIANGDITIAAGDVEFVSIACDDADVDRADGTSAGRSATFSSNPKNVIKFFSIGEDGTIPAGAGSDTVNLPMYETIQGVGRLSKTDGQIAIKGSSPGTTTLTVSLNGTTDTIQVTVTAPDNITFTRAGSTILYYPEGGQQTLHLDFGYNIPETVQFAVTSTDDGSHVTFDQTTLVALRNSSGADFAFNALDGANPSSITFTFTGDTAYTGGASATVMITNVPPVLQYPSTNPDNPTPISALAGAPFNFSSTATDASAVDRTSLTYNWSNSADTGANVSARVSADGEIITVSVSDKDQGTSETGYFQVTLLDSSKILFTDVCTIQSIVNRGGNGPADFIINPAGTQRDDASNPWDEALGNDFKADGNTMVRPVIPDGFYPFGWAFPDTALASSLDDLYIPNPNAGSIAINTPGAGTVATIRYFSSRPYYTFDDFGDFDQDGLSDDWEAYYLDRGKDAAQHTMDEWGTLAVTTASGELGKVGTTWGARDTFWNDFDTPDNDRIPTCYYEDIDNVWTDDPNYDPTDGAYNKVRVFRYPLIDGDNYVDYGTAVGDTGDEYITVGGVYSAAANVTRNDTTKPFFSNIMEFRGLPQASTATGGTEDNPYYVLHGYPYILGTVTAEQHGVRRGNCPGTDPTVTDTDGDALDDGWEYYFWSTILYQNKPEYWRAYDPSQMMYPVLAPGGSADFRAAGLPLLRRELDPNDYEESYSGGIFVRYPDETFEPIVIRDDIYYGSINLDPAEQKAQPTALTHTPVAWNAYYEPGAQVPTPAVVFTIGDPNDPEKNIKVYTREGHVDAFGRAKLFVDPYEDESYAGQDGWDDVYPQGMFATEPGEIKGAYVNFLTGNFYLPGYDAYPPQLQAKIGPRDAYPSVTVRYRTVNGLFPKYWLLSQFDPMNDEVLDWNDRMPGYPEFAAILESLGIDPKMWNPISDTDGDGLSNHDEFFLGTNPIHWDTDNDGLPDGWEVLFALDPRNPKDASENPDCDMFYWRGPYRHCDAYLYDYFQETWWNGQQSLGFVPGAGAHTSPLADSPIDADPNWNAAFTSLEEFYVQKWLIGKDDSGKYPNFVYTVYPANWVNDQGGSVKSCNPRSDDTDGDHIPDGWALYVGYKTGGIDLIDHVWLPFFGPLPPFCPEPLRPDPDDMAGDGLGWREEFENWTMYNKRLGEDGGAYKEENQAAGHYHPADWWKPAAEEWTNKLYPTDPWHGDTDGDGVSDAAEYKEDTYDWNGDGETLVNLNPSSADTRMDRFPDSWHYMTGTYDTENARGGDPTGLFSAYGDPDKDGLPNYQEYLAGAVYGWRYDWWYSPDNRELWVPFGEYQAPHSMKDSDLAAQIASDSFIASSYSVDPIGPGAERLLDVGSEDIVPIPADAYPYGKSVHFQPYRASDFFRGRPSNVRIREIIDTIERLEKRWQRDITSVTSELTGYTPDGQPQYTYVTNTVGGWDETFSPTLHDLERAEADPQFKVSVIANYMQRAYALTHDRLGRFDYTKPAFISMDEYFALYDGTPCAENDLRDYMFSYGCAPAGWEPPEIQVVDPLPPVVWRFMTPKDLFPACMPRNPDTDNDGMDDYWEIYHGLNPLYGGSPDIGGAGSYPDQDRADKHILGLGSTRDWYMQPNPAYVRVLSGGYAVSREPRAFYTMLAGYLMEAAHFDYKTRPWLAGDRFADPDQDGLANQEESYNYLLNDVLHHTDPSPYWFTDPSYAESYVNLYYAPDAELAGLYWWWDYDLFETDADGPSYLFDFEIGEGFDTDNDNVSDRVELTQDGNNGVTEPLDLDSPRKRKALYFDGYAAARTRNPYYHDKFTLTSYTVEFWVRPQKLPDPGKRMTLAQRPVLMPVDDSSGATHWRIRNTFLIQLDHLGKIHAQVDNDAIETVSSASAVSTGRLVPDHWAHVAVVMDSVEDRLSVYINGEYAGGVGAGLKPCTGGLFGFQWQSPTGTQEAPETANLYDYSPAPIVLGAYDRNPWGIVAGPRETFPWGTMNAGESSIAGQSEPDFDPDQFFVGWMDEVRIWDRCRTDSQIKNNMTKRFTKDDIEAINRERFRWEVDGWEPDKVGTNLVLATTLADFPQKVLYHYAFDNLPDVMPARDRDTSFMDYFTADADPFPAGWQSSTVSAYRPTPFWTAPFWYHYRSLAFPHLVPWWYTAAHRSNIYTDYSYVPWIENTVAHMPQTPALDMKGLFPNWNEGTWTVSSYRYRSPVDWLNDALGPQIFVPYRQDDVTPALLPASGSTDVQLGQIKNTMNPYVMFYRTALSIGEEVRPDAFAGKLDTYGIYRGIPVLSDMLPLLDAVADIDVEMWDGKGRGTELSAVDTDGDGMPDWWEISQGLDPNSADGANGAYGDPDHDGLDNYAEYLAHTNPYRYDTDSDGYSDYYSRPDGRSLTYGELYDDGDGIDNAWEIAHGLDPNRHDGNADLDGDGWTNWEEYMAGTDPDRADIFPQPAFNATFYYNGENLFKYEGQEGQRSAEPGVPCVMTYAWKTTGHEKVGKDGVEFPMMGGWFDSIYSGFVTDQRVFRSATADELLSKGGYTFPLFAQLDNVNIGSATISYTLNGSETTVEVKPWAGDPDYGAFLENKGKGSLGLLHFATGKFYLQPGNDSVGNQFTIQYSVGGRSFPYSVKGMTRMLPIGITHDHMVSGYNQFIGWLDLDGDYQWNPWYEPMGLGIPRPTLVSWDSVETTIPLTDSLWDYPRFSWEANVAALTNMVPTEYIVEFSYVGDVKNDPDSEPTSQAVGGGAYGDFDGDGLDPYQESLAGVKGGKPVLDPENRDTAGDGRLDYDSQSAAGTLTWGELYDDGDLMPSRWEIVNGLDPDRYDADGDADDDGWTNYEEYLGGTDPRSAASFPMPAMEIDFLYAGDYAAPDGSAANPAFATYSERRKGTTLNGDGAKTIYMGGEPDGIYALGDGYVANGLRLGSSGPRTVSGVQWPASTKLPYGNIVSATLTIRMDAATGAESDVSLTASEFNPEMLMVAADTDGSSIYIEKEAGYVLATGNYVGKTFKIEYQVDGYTYPMTATGFIRTKGAHAVGGYNRFFGWIDGNSDGTWNDGEPAGLSVHDAVLVGPDSVKTTIPLTDELFGFPRFSWPGSTNENVTAYQVFIENSAGTRVAKLKVEAPRTFVQEGDYIEAGLKGLDLKGQESGVYTWKVHADNSTGEEEIATGSFVLALKPNYPDSTSYTGTGTRRTMKAESPVGGSTVYGSLVEFKWQMDWRTEGVFFTVKNSAGTAVIDNLYVPFPVRHGKVTDDDYYYTCVPQLANGRSMVALPSGSYTYTIKENINNGPSSVPAQTVSGSFAIDNEQDGSRVRAAIRGHVHYYGRLGTAQVPGQAWVQAYPLPAAATTSLGVSGNPVAKAKAAADGSFALHGLSAGKYAVVGWVDSDGDGRFGTGDTQGWGFLGGSACPIQVTSWCSPLVITNSPGYAAIDLEDVHVVLRDRDTDGDGKPEAWTGTAATWAAAALRTFPASVPDGFDWVNTYLFSTTHVGRVVSTDPEDAGNKPNKFRGVVMAPRTFFHEADLFRCVQVEPVESESYGQPIYYGFNLGKTNVIDVTAVVTASDGWSSQILGSYSFRVNAGTETDRLKMKARYPTQFTKVHGNVVEFEWEMDHRNAGVTFNLWKLSGPDDETGTPVPGLVNRTIGFPLCHGKPGTDLCYYTAIPQLEDPKHFVSLEDGWYRYTIAERTRVSQDALRRYEVSGTFQLDNSGENRGLYAVEGNIRYYGKVMEREPIAVLGVTTNDIAADNTFETTVSTNGFMPGSMGVLLVRGSVANAPAFESTNNWFAVTNETYTAEVLADMDWAEEFFNDSAADGILYASSTTNATSTAWSGTIDYTTGHIRLEFAKRPPAGLSIVLVKKTFPRDLVLQVFKLADQAQTSTSVSGVPTAQIVRREKGKFVIPNLVGGVYAIRAFLDSNGNGVCDDWETQGVAVQTGTVSPNLDPLASPIVVRDNVTGLMIVLHDRDTDNDLLPDAWEEWKLGNLAESKAPVSYDRDRARLNLSGYETSSAGGLAYWQEYADGVLDSDPRTPDTDMDGLTDAMEILVTGTDTHLRDTDGDGVGDLEEFLAGSDPLSPGEAVPYAIPALAFDEDGVPYVDIAYPALRPGVVLTYELQRKFSLGETEAWETVASFDAANDEGSVFYSSSDGVNDHLSAPGTARMRPADQAEGVDFTTGFYRVKVYADYGKMVDNGDGTWSYWTWLRAADGSWSFREAARGEGTLVRDADGNWRFVDPDAPKASGSLYRAPNGDWKFVK